jgi:release factor glutamine methyltransferase
MTNSNLSIALKSHQEYILLAKLAKISLNQTLINPSLAINKYGHKEFLEKLQKLRQGHPLDYLVGEVEFAGKVFKINQHSLIPREETEYLVTSIQEFFKGSQKTICSSQIISKHSTRLHLNKPDLVVDIGCGCGVIGLSLSKYFKEVLMLDISKEVLDLAVDNSKHLAVDNSSFSFKTETIKTYTQVVDNYWLIANLPYVPDSEKEKTVEFNVDYEPKSAIFAGQDGLDVYRFYLHELSKMKQLPQLAVFELHKDNIHKAQKLWNENINKDYMTEILVDQNKLPRFLICLPK